MWRSCVNQCQADSLLKPLIQPVFASTLDAVANKCGSPATKDVAQAPFSESHPKPVPDAFVSFAVDLHVAFDHIQRRHTGMCRSCKRRRLAVETDVFQGLHARGRLTSLWTCKHPTNKFTCATRFLPQARMPPMVQAWKYFVLYRAIFCCLFSAGAGRKKRDEAGVVKRSDPWSCACVPRLRSLSGLYRLAAAQVCITSRCISRCADRVNVSAALA